MLIEEKPALAPSRRYSGPLGRLRFIATFVAPVAVVVALAAGIPYLANYQPLGLGNQSWAGRCLETMRIPTPDGGATLAFMACRHEGDAIAWGYVLENSGPFSIRVTSVSATAEPDSRLWPFGAIEIRTFDVRDNGSDEAEPETLRDPNSFETLEPFAPFTIAPGEARFIGFRGVLRHDCSYGGTLFSRVFLRYKVMGVLPRTDSLFAPIQVDICGQLEIG